MKIKFYLKKTEIGLYQLLVHTYDLWVVEYNDVFMYNAKSTHSPLASVTTVQIADGGINVTKHGSPSTEALWSLGPVISHIFIPFSSINFYEIIQENNNESY